MAAGFAAKGLKLPVTLGTEPLGTAAEFHGPLGGIHKRPQNRAGAPNRQGQRQGLLHQEAAGGGEAFQFQIVTMVRRQHHRQRPAWSWMEQVFDHQAHLGRWLQALRLMGRHGYLASPATQLANDEQIIQPTSPGTPQRGCHRHRQACRHGIGPSTQNDVHKLLMPYRMGLRDAGARDEGS